MEKKNKYHGTYSFFGRKVYVEVNRGKLTSTGAEIKLKVNDTQRTYDLLPQGKIFICYSGNTSEFVHNVQNALLLENLSPEQEVEWVPMAWNVLLPINAVGTSLNAQDLINKYIDKADHIVFIVKDKAGVGLKTEWDKFSNCINGKTIHLCIYSNENEHIVHNELDPLKKIIHFPFKDSNDILVYLKAKIHPEVILTGNEWKLQFVQTKEQLRMLQIRMKRQLAELKCGQVNPRIILKMEKLIKTIDEKGPEILIKNSNRLFKQPVLIKLASPLSPAPTIEPVHLMPTTKLVKGNKGKKSEVSKS